MRALLATAASALAACVLAAPGAAAPAGSLVWVGVPSGDGPFTQALNVAGYETLSGSDYDRVDASDDGRFVVFTGASDALSPDDDNRYDGVFVRDRAAGTTTLVSRPQDGQPANGTSMRPSISDDGRLVAFASDASNLVADDTNGVRDIFVRDLQTGNVRLVSRAPGAGGAIGGGRSDDADISGDGTVVVFVSRAANLLAADADTNEDIFRRRLSDDSLILVSVTGVAVKGNGDSTSPSVSDDGGEIAFASSATNLSGADVDPTSDVYRRVPGANSTALLSRADTAAGAKADAVSSDPVISGDGDVVVFTTASNAIDDAPGTADADAAYDVYTRKVSTNDTTLISRATGNAGIKGDSSSYFAAINDDGTRVSFTSSSQNLGAAIGDGSAVFVRDTGASPDTTIVGSTAPGDANGTSAGRSAFAGAGPRLVYAASAPSLPGASVFQQVFTREPPGAPELASVSPAPAPGQEFEGARIDVSGLSSPLRVLSDDGRYVAFTSYSPIFGSVGSTTLVLRRDLLTGETIIVSRGAGAAGPVANRGSSSPSISADGQRVAFLSSASNLHPDDGDTDGDIFVRDVAAGTTILASRADGQSGASPTGGVSDPRIAAGGGHVVFSATATTLVPGDGNAKADAFVRDLAAGTTVLASRADGPAGALGNGDSEEPDISGDGRIVAFRTAASNLGDGDADVMADVHVRDLAAAQTRLVSRATGATGLRAGGFSPVVSADGNVVAFVSFSALVGLSGTDAGVAVRNRAASTTTAVSRASGADGVIANDFASLGGVSSNGDVVTFDTRATNLGVTPGPETRFVWARRIGAAETVLVSRAPGPEGAPLQGRSGASSISGDGTCAAFDSRYAEPFPGAASPDFDNVFLRVIARECPKDPPETSIGGSDGRLVSKVARFTLSSDEPGSTFECRTGAAAFASCSATVERTGLPDGPLTIEARATDPAGLIDPTPAARTVTVAVKPVLTSLAVSPRRFRVGPRPTATTAARRPPRNTTIRFRTDEAGTARLTFARASAGRRVGASCRKPTRALRRRKACTRYTDLGRITRKVKAATVRVRFTGRIGRRALRPGRHRVSVTVTDAAGNRSLARTAAFTVVR